MIKIKVKSKNNKYIKSVMVKPIEVELYKEIIRLIMSRDKTKRELG